MSISNHSSIFVGMRGKYTATGPYSTDFNRQLTYTCVAIEDITGLIARGADPYEFAYAEKFISRSEYEQDDKDDIPLYTFQSNTGEFVVIPGKYIVGMPDSNGVKYSNIMLGISLSAIPNNFDLSGIKREISDLVFSRLGVRNEVKSIVFGTPSLISPDEHSNVNLARIANTINKISTISNVKTLTDQNTSLLNKVAVLEDFVKNVL